MLHHFISLIVKYTRVSLLGRPDKETPLSGSLFWSTRFRVILIIETELNLSYKGRKMALWRIIF